MRLIDKYVRPVYVLEFTWNELWNLFQCLRVLANLKPGEPAWSQLTADVANLDESPQRVAKKLADQLGLYVADGRPDAK